MDLGSHHEFVALLSKVVPATMVDLRPLSLPLDSLQFQEGCILELPFDNGSIFSLSRLCVAEHVGLGWYGNPLHYYGPERAIIGELKRILAPAGNLYLSVPIDGANRTYFNAHRAFGEDYLFELLDPLHIVENRYIFGNSFSEQPKAGFGVGCYSSKRG